jgi:hypothetical protein
MTSEVELSELLGANDGLFSITSAAFGLRLSVGALGVVGLSSSSIWNMDVIPPEVLIGFGDLIARSLLGLITIGSGRLPAF